MAKERVMLDESVDEEFVSIRLSDKCTKAGSVLVIPLEEAIRVASNILIQVEDAL